MLPYGSKRIYAKCYTFRCKGGGAKVHIKQFIKSKKFGRNFNSELEK